jgi:hypothetical protein
MVGRLQEAKQAHGAASLVLTFRVPAGGGQHGHGEGVSEGLDPDAVADPVGREVKHTRVLLHARLLRPPFGPWQASWQEETLETTQR